MPKIGDTLDTGILAQMILDSMESVTRACLEMDPKISPGASEVIDRFGHDRGDITISTEGPRIVYEKFNGSYIIEIYHGRNRESTWSLLSLIGYMADK